MLNPEGHQNHIIDSKVIAILMKWWILPVGGVVLGRVCSCRLRSTLVIIKFSVSHFSLTLHRKHILAAKKLIITSSSKWFLVNVPLCQLTSISVWICKPIKWPLLTELLTCIYSSFVVFGMEQSTRLLYNRDIFSITYTATLLCSYPYELLQVFATI